jgi:hypothetical protein
MYDMMKTTCCGVKARESRMREIDESRFNERDLEAALLLIAAI